ncbi:hypothetical protein SAMN05216249_1026 [Acetitomaculum ruminis DSM 5522]|uniref:Ribosomal processing cysteine protease Prp n=1 Tax=Acetitomaculum ruminis DSM 5522 TaxID=1120918 RepID=A0A1I0VHT1_9FIRM|nr:ribosomal-processing cysteine protease Prp [Acetitomaculum ruminis]SFA75597.1 hypothetical protein SAMN05216249_1026 [Acetitomaculum ruminis DSM 5522]
MTNVLIYQDSEGLYRRFRVYGHAGYATSGEDLVCCAISTLVINTINSIEAFTDDDFCVDVDEKSGDIDCRLDTCSKDVKLLVDSMVLGLTKIMENDNDKYIRIIHEEV